MRMWVQGVRFHLLGNSSQTAKSSGLYHRFMLTSHGSPNSPSTLVLSSEDGLIEEGKEHGATVDASCDNHLLTIYLAIFKSSNEIYVKLINRCTLSIY